MLKLLVLVAVLFAFALGFQWLKTAEGEVVLTLGDTAYAVDLGTAAVALVVGALLAIGLLWFVRELVRAPWRFARGWRRRSRARGHEAVAQGLIAIAAGDLRGAERATLEASRRVPDQPLTRLLTAQTAQLKGDRVAARRVFQDMTEDRATRIAGLRGLYVEAEREGEQDAARQIAERAREEAPSAPWAARALLSHQTAAQDWDAALRTLSGAADGRILDKRTARRQRAVILTAKALDREDGEPDAARHAALEAHDLAPDLVPAAVAAGRLLARQGDVRRAARILEAAWKANPHPEIADAYLHVRAGDAAADRLKRAEALHRMRPHADEGRLAVTRAAIDAREFSRARDVMKPILTTRPTRRALILMATLEEAETGDSGRARGWMARAVHAAPDPAWTADGVVLDHWAPVSPVTGRLDAVEWKVPVLELAAPSLSIDAAELIPPPLPPAGGDADAKPAAIAAAPAPEPPESGLGAAGRPAASATTGSEAAGPAAGPGVEPSPQNAAAGDGADTETPPAPPAPPAPPPLDGPAPGEETDEPVRPPVPDDPGVAADTEEPEPGRKRRFRVL